MLIPKDTPFEAVRAADLVPAYDSASFWRAKSGSVVVEPPGTMPLPPVVLTNRDRLPAPMHGAEEILADGRFPASVDYPALHVTRLGPAWCLPFAPPILFEQRQIVSDFLIPWLPEVIGWFNHKGGNRYHTKDAIDTAGDVIEVDAGLYLDHPVSGDFGHFIVDCLSRIHAVDICRRMFPEIKIIMAQASAADAYRMPLLAAAGIPDRDILRVDRLVHCRNLMLATNAFWVLRYTSPTATRLWGRIRDAMARRDPTMPDRVYLSRSGVPGRPLINEREVEEIFREHGFAIVRPEKLPIGMQVALVRNARLVAGPAGSNMLNLAFQARMESVFVIAPQFFIGPSEQYCGAGHSGDVYYHIGSQVGPDVFLPDRTWQVDAVRLAADVDAWLTSVGR